MFINCKQRTTLVEDDDNEGGYACVGAEATGEISEPSLEYCHESKPAIKIKSIKKISRQSTLLWSSY